jgi:DNA polymerase-3 subunit epsilon
LQLFFDLIGAPPPAPVEEVRRTRRRRVAIPIIAAPPLVVEPVPTPVPLPEPAPAVAPPLPRIIVFDVETTGTDKLRDQIIELGIQCGLDDGGESWTWRFRPDVPISPGAQAVHGISAADLDGCPRFAERADEIAALFASADVIVGYNLAFDIDMMQSEYDRLGRAPIDFAGKTIVDAFRLWQQCEPRSLQHAHRRFVGDGFAAAHSASADVAATARVLRGMLATFELADRDWTAIATVCDPNRASWIGPSRHLQWQGDAIVFGFGRHQGTPVVELARSSPDYLEWIVNKDFPAHVCEVCREAMARSEAELVDWVRARFGRPAPVG